MIGPMDVFKITAVLPLLVASIAFFIDEEPIRKDEMKANGEKSTSSQRIMVEMQPDVSITSPELPISASQSQMEVSIGSNNVEEHDGSYAIGGEVSDQIQSLWMAIKEPAIWKPALFLFLWQSTPTSDGAFLYFMTNDLGFGPEFLGRVRLATAAASLLGVWGYQKFLREVRLLMFKQKTKHHVYCVISISISHSYFTSINNCMSNNWSHIFFLKVPIKTILLWTSIASAPLGLINLLLISHVNRSLGIPDGAFVFGDDVVLAILGEFAFLPTLVLAARICPPGVEAVLFATLMSIFNGASTVGTEIGALLTKMLGVTESNFDNLGILTIVCNLTSLYPLLFIGLLDGVGTKSEAEIEEESQLSSL